MNGNRPRAQLVESASLTVPGWLADWLDLNTNLGQVRRAVRGKDVLVDDALIALRRLAVAYRDHVSAGTGTNTGAAHGTSLAVEPLPGASSEVLLGTAEAGRLAGLKDRSTRKAITEGRLPGRLVGGRYVVKEADARSYGSSGPIRRNSERRERKDRRASQ